jgi:hypothetical protein
MQVKDSIPIMEGIHGHHKVQVDLRGPHHTTLHIQGWVAHQTNRQLAKGHYNEQANKFSENNLVFKIYNHNRVCQELIEAVLLL